jgi:hypothetical protein
MQAQTLALITHMIHINLVCVHTVCDSQVQSSFIEENLIHMKEMIHTSLCNVILCYFL